MAVEPGPRRSVALVLIACAALIGCSARAGGTSPAGGSGTVGSSPSATPAPTAFADRVVVNGHGLYVECRGTGSPTILMENGAGGAVDQWDAVFERFSEATRSCRYDLPNTGSSDHGQPVRNVDDDVDDIEALVAAGVMAPPFLLAAYSAGAFPAWRFTNRHPGDVVGIVFVDPLLPGYEAAYQRLLKPDELPARKAERAGGNDFAYDFTASEERLDPAAAFGALPVTVVANDRHIRWEGCGDSCESLTGVEQGLIDDLVDDAPGRAAIRVVGTHAVIKEHPDVVARAVLEMLDAVRR